MTKRCKLFSLYILLYLLKDIRGGISLKKECKERGGGEKVKKREDKVKRKFVDCER